MLRKIMGKSQGAREAALRAARISAAIFEPVERRLLMASISGIVFGDYNGNGAQDPAEPGLPGWTVYLDANDNGLLDSGESSALTTAGGAYAFDGLAVGTHVVREVLPEGWSQTVPGSGGVLLSGAIDSPASVDPARPYTSTEIVVAFNGEDGLSALQRRRRDARIAGKLDLARSHELMTVGGMSLVTVALPRGVNPLAAVESFQRLPGVRWAQPNYIYNRGVDPRDFTPNDPFFPNQYHHALMQNNLAWDTTQGAGVIIAVADDGVSLTHPELSTNLWVNADEIAGNGLDDDNNGHIDDVNGWDFSANDNDVTPSAGYSHGTHVAGVATATSNNGVGVASSAGAATLMPLRFYGSSPWTSTVVADSYRYAADNGAKILNVSYDINGFVNDAVFLSAMQYVHDHGMLYFNSAGNSGALNPARQVFGQVMLVVNTDTADEKSPSSNYGWGMDISAPGTSILSTVPGNSYALLTGTSMASPNAAAAAALIWSAHPTWTRDQVAAQLLGTADDLSAANPAYVGLLGAGRVNSYRGVTQSTIAPPRLKSLLGLPAESGMATSLPATFTLDVASVFDPSTVVAGSFELRGDGADNTFGTADDTLVPLTLDTPYAYGTNRLTFSIAGSVGSDTYRFSALSSLADPFGQSLDGNADGTSGDAFTRTFQIIGLTNPYRVTINSSQQSYTAAHFGNRDEALPLIGASDFEFETRHAVSFTFSKDVSASLSAADLVLHNDTAGQTINTSDLAVLFDVPSLTATFVYSPGQLPDGNYTATLLGAGVSDLYGNSLASDGMISFFALAGDANRDRVVDITDLGILATNWQGAGKLFSDGDFNYDGTVDITDLGILATNWQKSQPLPSTPTQSSTTSSRSVSSRTIDRIEML